MQLLSCVVAAAAMASIVIAHPGEHHDAALVKRQMNIQEARAAHAKRSLANCARSQSVRSFHQRNVERRELKAQKLREKAGISKSCLFNHHVRWFEY